MIRFIQGHHAKNITGKIQTKYVRKLFHHRTHNLGEWFKGPELLIRSKNRYNRSDD